MSALLAFCMLCIAGLSAWALLLKRRAQDLQCRITSLQKDLDHSSRMFLQKSHEHAAEQSAHSQLLDARDDFISIVSHQLRTPVTEVKWGLKALLDSTDWQLPTDKRQSIELLYTSVQRLVEIIDDVLALVSIEQSPIRVTVESYKPDELVRLVAERVAKDFADKQIHLTIEPKFDDTIDSMDHTFFSMVFSNLLENAYHYTPQGGSILVETSRTPGGDCRIKIADTGMGISPEQQKSLFVKFLRSEEASKVNASGSGLGLYIVKNIITRHGGDINFKSSKGQGTTFIYTVPRKQRH